ncbi:hypothetical protein ACIOFQ_26750 [[Kitasatospora] papulosa]|uniref:hypothetical protein n=1 Tax=Streptomyces TaxID=1883 RepID=UPI0026DFCB21|nr:hypothetical protein [Streptomyces sp. SNU607]WKV77514.1 hypothetical protein HBB06_04890 [Streptomyces sp. SNU607]
MALEYVARVVVVVPLTTCAFRVSYGVVPDSLVSIARKKLSLGAAAVAGTVTVWESVSVCALPYPSSQA